MSFVIRRHPLDDPYQIGAGGFNIRPGSQTHGRQDRSAVCGPFSGIDRHQLYPERIGEYLSPQCAFCAASRDPHLFDRAQSGVFAKSQDMAHVHRAAEAIRRNAMLQSPMVDDLLDVSLIAHGTVKLDLHLHDLSALVHSAVDTSAQAITAKSLALEFNDAHTPLIVEGDAGRLQQVFGNIISNAVKFSPDAGDIRIMIGREENTATVAVTDSGARIAPEFLPFEFEMFRHRSVVTSASTRGSGSDWRW